MKKINMKTILDEGWRMLAAIVLIGLGLLIFTVPNNIVPGGVSGLATALAAVLPLKIGTINLLLSILIEGIGCLNFGFLFIVRSGIVSVGLSLFLNIFEGRLPVYTSDPLVAAIAAGVLFGISSGILLSRGISSGGTDTVSLIVKKFFPRVSVGKVLMAADASIMLLGVLIFRNIDVAIYSAFTIFCSGQVVDRIIVGMDFAKLVYVITEESESVQSYLVDELGLGVTVLSGKGGFSKNEKGILMLAVKKKYFSAVVRGVKKLDPASFVIVQDASEIWGEGFKEQI